MPFAPATASNPAATSTPATTSTPVTTSSASTTYKSMKLVLMLVILPVYYGILYMVGIMEKNDIEPVL
jgi:hypothetical protein